VAEVQARRDLPAFFGRMRYSIRIGMGCECECAGSPELGLSFGLRYKRYSTLSELFLAVNEVTKIQLLLQELNSERIPLDWSFNTLFGRTIERSCPVASSSVILVDLHSDDTIHELYPEPAAWSVDKALATYHTQNGMELTLLQLDH
jgi:hypothetical protein